MNHSRPNERELMLQARIERLECVVMDMLGAIDLNLASQQAEWLAQDMLDSNQHFTQQESLSIRFERLKREAQP